MSSITLQFPLHGLRSQLLHWCYRQSYPLYARLTRHGRPHWQIGAEGLAQLPPGSLGYKLNQFLSERQLSLMPGFENHDVYHLLTAYGTSAPEEVALQCCLVGNGKRTAYAIMTALVGIAFFPEHWGFFHRAFQRGKNMRPFHHWYFEYLLRENLSELQAFLNHRKTDDYVANY